MIREVAAVGEAVLSLTDAGGLLFKILNVQTNYIMIELLYEKYFRRKSLLR